MDAKTEWTIASAMHTVAGMIERGELNTKLCRYCGDVKHPNRQCVVPPLRENQQ